MRPNEMGRRFRDANLKAFGILDANVESFDRIVAIPGA